MDYLEKETVKDFTYWDLNIPNLYKCHNYKKNKQYFKRKARRKLKQEMKKNADMVESVDTLD